MDRLRARRAPAPNTHRVVRGILLLKQVSKQVPLLLLLLLLGANKQSKIADRIQEGKLLLWLLLLVRLFTTTTELRLCVCLCVRWGRSLKMKGGYYFWQDDEGKD